jgi:hypothetical protein
MRLIDADPFKKDLQDGADRHEYGWDSYDKGAYQAYTDAIELLDEQPTVEPERKKGKWISYLQEGLRYKCSECESRYEAPWHFCPNCGTDMREEDV